VDGPKNLAQKHMGWRLAAIVSAHTPLPEHIRHRWPDLLGYAPFIVKMVETLDRTESLTDMNMRIGMEMMGHLRGGPFMGGSKVPTVADFALFPQLVFPLMVGLTDKIPVASHLPKNPTLVPDEFIIAHLE